MKKINYDKETDILIIEFSEKPIEYAEEEGPIIIHFAKDDEPVLLEIQGGKEFILNTFTSMINEKEVVFS
jgi:uncharacterized protein YuzE